MIELDFFVLASSGAMLPRTFERKRPPVTAPDRQLIDMHIEQLRLETQQLRRELKFEQGKGRELCNCSRAQPWRHASPRKRMPEDSCEGHEIMNGS